MRKYHLFSDFTKTPSALRSGQSTTRIGFFVTPTKHWDGDIYKPTGRKGNRPEIVAQLVHETSSIDMENLPLRGNPALPQTNSTELLAAGRPESTTPVATAPVLEEETTVSDRLKPPNGRPLAQLRNRKKSAGKKAQRLADSSRV
jgi:hypothetical protein